MDGCKNSWFDTHLLGYCAAMAQRKGELLKLETLERLASLHGDLHHEATLATQSG